MSWNDYYRFRYSAMRSKGPRSKLPLLPELFFLLGVPFAITTSFATGGGHPWSDMNGPTFAAISIVLGFWFLATIGEILPRTALSLMLLGGVATVGLLFWVWRNPDLFAHKTPSDGVLAFLSAYPLFVVVVALKNLLSLAPSDPAV